MSLGILLPLLLGLADAAAPPAPAPSPAPAEVVGEPPAWQATLTRAANSVVAIRVRAVRAFDTERAGSAVATGFVVDAELGLILTNRHVVEPGPVTAEAVFQDHEEVPIWPVYRDPVHDFGFYRFDPKLVRHQEVVALPLCPECAKVGTDIRVAGNDAGEKISFLSGILARLDRDAPVYGKGYNDFNTFYLQAASSTSGGSSGSPVLDQEGRVIALNAGARRDAATSFFLPLDRVVRALELLRQGRPVSRGTWGAVLNHESFDQLRRLGLRPETEDLVRKEFPEGTGMLVVAETVPGGSARDRLRPGDVLVRLDGRLVTTFVPWEALLDERVGGDVKVEVERGGKPLELEVPVGDLHAATPSKYLEIGGALLHPVSFQVSRNYALAPKGIFVADSGAMFAQAGVPDGAVLLEVDGQPVGTLEELELRLGALPQGAPFQVRYVALSEVFNQRSATAFMDRRWFPSQRCVRDDTTGLWPCTPSPANPRSWTPEPQTAGGYAATSRGTAQAAETLVWVDFDAAHRPEGLYGSSFIGTGVIVDAARGIVVTDRDTVPVMAGDVVLTFGGTLRVPARILAVHPFHNLAVLRYDPAAIGDTPVRAARFVDRPLERGLDVTLVGFTGDQSLQSAHTSLDDRSPVETSLPDPPYFRDVNTEAWTLDDSAGVSGGVVLKGRDAVGLWASYVDPSTKPWSGFHRMIPAATVLDAIAPFLGTAGSSAGPVGGPSAGGVPGAGQPTWRTLGAELTEVPIAVARDAGLPAADLEELARLGGTRRQVVMVRRVTAGTDAARNLASGDLILKVEGRWVTQVDEVEAVARSNPKLALTVLHDGKPGARELSSQQAGGQGVDRMVLWAGALLHETPLSISQQRNVAPGGLYVSWVSMGSPAQGFQLWATRRITAVDDVEVKNLDAFLAAVKGRAEGSSVRLTTRGLDGKESVVTLKLDLHYWPTTEFRLGTLGWERIPR